MGMNKNQIGKIIGAIVGAALVAGATWGITSEVNAIDMARAQIAANKAASSLEFSVMAGSQIRTDTPSGIAALTAQGNIDAKATSDADWAAAQAALAAQQAAAAAAAQAAAVKARDDSIIHCPAGTIAGAVDGAGNESDCQPENGQGEVCQAYNDANQCIGWAKP